MASTSSTTTPFPKGARVILTNLKTQKYNDKKGTVQSLPTASSSERQQVHIPELNETHLFKIVNLKYEPRSIASLSVKELKSILKFQNVEESEWRSGVDKVDLRRLVAEQIEDGGEMEMEMDMEEERVAQLVAKATAATSSSSSSPLSSSTSSTTSSTSNSSFSNMSTEQIQSQAQALSSMDPSQLRQQARMMRSMDTATLRRMNPAMASMSDAQIQQAITQMEIMANNPGMMKMASEQMKNMSAEDLQRMQQGQFPGMGSTPAGTTSPSTSATTTNNNTSTPASFQTQAQQLSSMSPSQLRQQATMMRSMNPTTLRQLNPAMASMSDEQIEQAIAQMELMADNPEMMQMASEQMKNLSAEDLQELQGMQEQLLKNGGGAAAAGSGNADPMKMLESMDAKQIKKMVGILKKNPAMMRQVMSSQSSTAGNGTSTTQGMAEGMSDEQLSKTLQAFDNMTEDQIDKAMKAVKTVGKVTAPVRKGWQTVNGWVGGQLGKVLVLGVLGVVGWWVKGWWMGSEEGGMVLEEVPVVSGYGQNEEDFADEFAIAHEF